MLRKVLKHDFKSVFRYWSIAAITVLCASLIGATVLRIMDEVPGNSALASSELANTVVTILLVACIFSVVVFFAVGEILVFFRYYKNFFTDEGYLTFTLPVSRRTLLASKTINAMIWTALNALVTFICVLIYLLIATDIETLKSITELGFLGIGKLLHELWSFCGWWIVVYAIEGLILSVVTLFSTVSSIQMSITIGSTVAKKHKVLASIGVYYLTNYIVSTVTSAVTSICISITNSLDLHLTFASNSGHIATVIMILTICITHALLAAICYIINLRTLEKKLNLA